MGYTWDKWQQNVLAFERPWNIASFAYKWVGEEETTCVTLPDFKTAYKRDPFDDSRLLKELYKVLDEADLIVGHNVKKFDLRKINARLLKHFHTPPSPYDVYDTLTEARKVGMFPSNSLGDLAKFLDCPIGGKVEHEGFGLWLKCMAGDKDAWERMREYNSQDVDINEWVYERLRPWSKTHPNVTLDSGEPNLCPRCGSKTHRRGWRNCKTYKARLYHCLNPECGAWPTGSREKILVPVLS